VCCCFRLRILLGRACGGFYARVSCAPIGAHRKRKEVLDGEDRAWRTSARGLWSKPTPPGTALSCCRNSSIIPILAVGYEIRQLFCRDLVTRATGGRRERTSGRSPNRDGGRSEYLTDPLPHPPACGSAPGGWNSRGSERSSESRHAAWGRRCLVRPIRLLAATTRRASPGSRVWRASLTRTSETVRIRKPKSFLSYSFGPSLHTGSYYGLC